MIINSAFSDEEKKLLNFILAKDFESKEETVRYINSLSAEHIVRDHTPYHKIMEFRTPNIEEGHWGMSEMIFMQTIRKDGSAPTVFCLYAKDGFPFEFESYNADGSAMDMDNIFNGETVVD